MNGEKKIPALEEKPSLDPAGAIREDRAVLFEEMTVYLSSYVASKIDSVKLAAKESFFAVFFQILSLLILKSVLIIAVAFSMYGIAAGLGRAFGEEAWLAYLLTGLFFLSTMGLSFKIYWAIEKRKSLKTKVREYEEELERQRAKFGHDAAERASASPE